ncbi:unnamed protein product [Cochlearia groenlandica]
MLEAVDNTSVLNGGFSQIHHSSFFGECSSEEELTVLPRHTKVVVTGNNRTKSVLVGLHGVVKKAVGLGGWHWLVLTNGIEVKLQRNALSVIEAPTGNEQYSDLEVDHTQWIPSQISKFFYSFFVTNKTFISTIPNASFHFDCFESLIEEILFMFTKKIDLSKLDTPALLRYWQHYSLVDALPNPSKEQLLDIVQRHFMSNEMDELQVIVGFVQAAKSMQKASKLQTESIRRRRRRTSHKH